MISKSFLHIFVFILLLVDVSAVGLVPAIHEVDFEPGRTYEFKFYARADPGFQTPVVIYMMGELSKYVEPKEYIYPKCMETTVPESGVVPFTFKVKIPKDANPTPGKNTIAVYVADAVSTGGTIGVSTAVEGWLTFLVPYPGKYADLYFDIANTNINRSTNVNLRITSRGKEPLLNTNAVVEIRDKDDVLKDVINFNDININSGETTTLSEILHSENYLPGKYFGKATYFYEGDKKEAKAEFKVGVLELKLLRTTEKLIEEKINKFEMLVENQWNNELEEVYATGEIYNQNFKSPTIEMQQFAESMLQSYIDTTGFQLGPAEVKINLFFKEKGEDKVYSSEQKVSVEIIEEAVETKEEEKKQGFNSITLTLIIVVFVLLVIIFDIIWLKKRKRKEP
ncbi:hypothetical protein JXA85_01665 [Candidatus Woesearchaeota archaeon]|nr:hypothetical protein [Candidatus Woesearchaeota archaeon]